MTDVIPGLFLLTVRTWPTTIGGRGDATKVGILAAATIFAIYVNSYQGLFNVYTALWNGEPNIDLHPEYLFDWRYPQFLNNERRQKERADESRAAADAVAAKLRSLQNLATTGTLKVSELSNDTLPISSITPTQFGAPAAILTALYNATFGRPPDRPTLSFYLAYATTHPVTPLTQYALWFLTSPEYTGLPAHRYAESITGNSRFIADSLFNLLHQSVAVSDIAAYQTIFVNPLLRGLEPGTDSYQAAELQARAQFLVFLSLILQRDEELPKSPLN